jgi:hypothetical protein
MHEGNGGRRMWHDRTNHWICGKPLTLGALRLDLSRKERER